MVDGIKRFDANLLRKIFSKVEDRRRLELIVESLSDIDLENLTATIRQTTYKKALRDFEDLLQLEDNGDIVAAIAADQRFVPYRAGKPEDVFRKWLERNLWVFGVEYHRRHDWRIVADDAVADIVMETADGFSTLSS